MYKNAVSIAQYFIRQIPLHINGETVANLDARLKVYKIHLSSTFLFCNVAFLQNQHTIAQPRVWSSFPRTSIIRMILALSIQMFGPRCSHTLLSMFTVLLECSPKIMKTWLCMRGASIFKKFAIYRLMISRNVR